MAAKLFDQILAQGMRAGQMPGRSSTARNWYREKAKSLGKINETSLLRGDNDRLKQRFGLGNMYFFMYDPKHKKTLPYYDTFPLIFPIDISEKHILGINFHYLPHKLRAKLMDALYEHVTNERYDEKTKMKISYGILKSATKYREFKPTIKKYLKTHIRSRLVYIHPAEWDAALFLNVAQFEGANQTKVWQDSRKIIQGK